MYNDSYYATVSVKRCGKNLDGNVSVKCKRAPTPFSLCKLKLEYFQPTEKPHSQMPSVYSRLAEEEPG